MKKQTRHGVFETNSSSTHSITISKAEMLEQVDLSGQTLVLDGDEFGWEWRRYNDWETKANYCAQFLSRSQSYGEKATVDEFRAEMLEEVIKEHTGASSVAVVPTGYIDHDSVHVANDAFKDEESLRNFIFNPNSYLFTGNDNEEAPPNFYDPVEVKYTHKVCFTGINFDETFKVAGLPGKKELIDGLTNLWSHYCSSVGWGVGCDYNDTYILANYSMWEDNEDHFKELDQGHVIVDMRRDGKSVTKKVKFKISEI
jgi:hypothetical protein